MFYYSLCRYAPLSRKVCGCLVRTRCLTLLLNVPSYKTNGFSLSRFMSNSLSFTFIRSVYFHYSFFTQYVFACVLLNHISLFCPVLMLYFSYCLILPHIRGPLCNEGSYPQARETTSTLCGPQTPAHTLSCKVCQPLFIFFTSHCLQFILMVVFVIG